MKGNRQRELRDGVVATLELDGFHNHEAESIASLVLSYLNDNRVAIMVEETGEESDYWWAFYKWERLVW